MSGIDGKDARAFLTGKGIDVDAIAPQLEGKLMSAFVRVVTKNDRDVTKPRRTKCRRTTQSDHAAPDLDSMLSAGLMTTLRVTAKTPKGLLMMSAKLVATPQSGF